jgi:flagellar assembly protein FliH
MQQLQISIPAPVVALRLGGPLGDEALAAMVRSMQPVGPDQDEQLRQEFKQTLEQQKQQVASAVAGLGQAARQLQQLREQIVAEAEQELLAAAVELAGIICAQQIEAGNVKIDPILEQALTRLPARENIRIHLNPQDFQQCQLAAKGDEADTHSCYEFIQDPQIQPGECLLETDEASVEHTVQESIETLQDALVGSDDA